MGEALVQCFLREFESVVFVLRVGGGEIQQEWRGDDRHFDCYQGVVVSKQSGNLKFVKLVDVALLENLISTDLRQTTMDESAGGSQRRS